MNIRHSVGLLALVAFAGMSMAASITVPPRAASNKSLVVSEEQKKLGTVYYTAKMPASRGVKFTSEALNEKIDGIATDVVGFLIAGPADNPAKLAGGAWRVGVKSIDTKITERNGHLQGKQWLNADANPDITFALKEVNDVKLTKEMQNAAKTYMGTFKGEMTINGKTKDIEIPNVMMMVIPESDQTKPNYKGNLMSIRCKYEVKLSDYGITNDVITETKKVSDTIKIDQELLMATVPAEDQPEFKSTPVEKPAVDKKAEPKKEEPKKDDKGEKPKPAGG